MSENGRAADSMPQTIGRYQVAESVGFGAMGAVYKAFDPLIKRTLAIKTIRLDIPRQSPQYRSFIDRFYHEARISRTLSHPNTLTLSPIGTSCRSSTSVKRAACPISPWSSWTATPSPP